MSAKINTIIPAAAFESIRDALGAVLFLELSNQQTLDNTFKAPSTVWIERFVPFNTNEFPAVNIRFQEGNYIESSREVAQVHAIYTYFIDVSVIAKSNATTAGDARASVDLHRIVRIIRGVLASPEYDTIGFDRPFNKRAWVNSITVQEPMDFTDSTNQINARVEYCIEVPEASFVKTLSSAYLLNEITTTVKLNQSNYGFFWDYKQKQITIVTSGTTLTNSFFSNPITKILIGATEYEANTDFTQSGTTITASTFSFTASTTITAFT